MDMQQDITDFQSGFNGPFPFTTDGVLIGIPNAGFEEEMQTMITFANGSIDLDTLHHENMHQWWGDNVSEANYNLTFFKEGHGDARRVPLRRRAMHRRAAGWHSAAAFEQSLVDTFNANYADSELLWTARPVRPDARTRCSRARRPTPARDRVHRPAPDPRPGELQRRAAADPARLPAGEHHRAAARERRSRRSCPGRRAACSAQLDQFFTQWCDTVYPPGGGANRPQITGPGLDGGGFHC